ncbi:hypothetical protein [Maritimibacter sp. DP1N21-5]|uniref:hypothetical protein n=1 Tax=Maritimibacter sp. DP1N21-5 TaxID=2836867 RepID=UPI001C46A5FE|nr:hypothetical protein [Maritimibacter sp. DP1N21-5]MBV7408731.1 hypothetical protein [Maritimibacter sp. DP1N21-5]
MKRTDDENDFAEVGVMSSCTDGEAMSAREPDSGLYCVIVEWKLHGPTILELERDQMDDHSTRMIMNRFSGMAHVVRVCRARLVFDHGNEAMFDALSAKARAPF